MYYYETGLINDFILYIEGDRMKYICVNGPYQAWEDYGAPASYYLLMLHVDKETSLMSISEKKVILLGLPLCK